MPAAAARVVIPEAHSPKQQLIMDALSMPGLSELWVACGTKFGKTFALGAGYSRKGLLTQGGLGRWIAPIYSQSKIGFKYCKKFLPPPPHTKADNKDLSLRICALDTTLEFRSGRYPEDLEGEGIDIGNALDEAAKMQEQVYISSRTTVSVTRAPIVAISTPRGKNWFHTRCMAAKEEMEWALKRGIEPRKIFITAPSRDNPKLSSESIEEARKSMPKRLFDQYYDAAFIDDGAVFSGFRLCLFTDELPIPTGLERQSWVCPLWSQAATGAQIVIGADWAKTKDYTVFTAIDVLTRRVIAFQRFHKTPYTEAIRKLVIFAKNLTKKGADLLVVFHDKTGLGNVIDDQLAYTALPYQGVTFTNAIKAHMVAQVITAFEQQMLGIPHWLEMLSELDSFEVNVNEIGTMTYNAADGKHDDIVSSLLLAYAALVQYGDESATVKFLEELKKAHDGSSSGKDAPGDAPKDPIEEFYRSLGDDDDD